MVNILGNCTKWKTCNFFSKNKKCSGCSYQHLEKFLSEYSNDSSYWAFKILREDVFDKSSKRAGEGGRITMDASLKKILKEAHSHDIVFPKLEELKENEKQFTLDTNVELLHFKIKQDGAFRVANTGKLIFFECKGYGTDTNSMHSAILAALMARQCVKFKECLFYYIGAEPRNKFFRKNASSVYPLMKWAEQNGTITGFYGVTDLPDILSDIKKRVC